WRIRRSLAPWLVFAIVGLIGGITYRYFADDPNQGTVGNYVRSAIHGMGLALSGWATHLYFVLRTSEWLRRWPLTVEGVVHSLVMALVVATVAVTLQAVLYSPRLETAWLATSFPGIVAIAFVTSAVAGAVYELKRLTGGRVLMNVVLGRYRRPTREERVVM